MIFTMINHDNPWNLPMTFMKNHTKNHPKPSQLALDSLRCSTWFHWHRHGISASIYFFQVIRSAYDQFIESAGVGTSEKSESKWETQSKNTISNSGRLDCTKSLNHQQIHTMSHCIFVVTSHFLWCLHRVGTTSLQSSKKFSAPTSPSTGFALRSSDVDPFTGPLEQNADGSTGSNMNFRRKDPEESEFRFDFWWIYGGFKVDI